MPKNATCATSAIQVIAATQTPAGTPTRPRRRPATVRGRARRRAAAPRRRAESRLDAGSRGRERGAGASSRRPAQSGHAPVRRSPPQQQQRHRLMGQRERDRRDQHQGGDAQRRLRSARRGQRAGAPGERRSEPAAESGRKRLERPQRRPRDRRPAMVELAVVTSSTNDANHGVRPKRPSGSHCRPSAAKCCRSGRREGPRPAPPGRAGRRCSRTGPPARRTPGRRPHVRAARGRRGVDQRGEGRSGDQQVQREPVLRDLDAFGEARADHPPADDRLERQQAGGDQHLPAQRAP